MKKKIGALGTGQFSLGTLVEGRPGTTIFQNPVGGGGGLWGVAYKDPARPPPRDWNCDAQRSAAPSGNASALIALFTKFTNLGLLSCDWPSSILTGIGGLQYPHHIPRDTKRKQTRPSMPCEEAEQDALLLCVWRSTNVRRGYVGISLPNDPPPPKPQATQTGREVITPQQASADTLVEVPVTVGVASALAGTMQVPRV